jgi:PAS domain S-box-containing protein
VYVDLITSVEKSFLIATGKLISITQSKDSSQSVDTFDSAQDSSQTFDYVNLRLNDPYGNTLVITITSLLTLTLNDVELIQSLFKIALFQSDNFEYRTEDEIYLDGIDANNNFFIALNKSGNILRCGTYWKKAQFNLETGCSFLDYFTIDNSTKSLLDYLEYAKINRNITFFKFTNFNGRFKSTVIQYNQMYVLLVQPVINSDYSLKIYDLTLKDFLPHEYIAEFVFLQATSQKSLEDSQKLLTKIKERNKEIESISRFPSENPSPILRLTTEGQILYSNDATKKYFLEDQIKKEIDFKTIIKSTILSDNKILDGECYLNNRTYLYRSIYFEKEQYLNMYLFDITYYLEEIKKLNNDVIIQRDFYEQILNRIPNEISLFDETEQCIFTNTEKRRGADKSAITSGKEDFEFNDKDALLALNRLKLLKKVLTKKKEYEIVEEYSLSDGRKQYILQKFYPVINNDILDFVIVYSTNISAIVESQEKNKLLIEASPDIIQSVDENGKILFCNDVWLHTLGYRVEEVIGKNIFDFIAPQCLQQCQVLFTEIMQSGKGMHNIEVDFATKKGEVIYTQGNVTITYEKNKLVTNAFFKNITNEKKKAAEILSQQHFYENILDNLPTEILVLNKQKDIVYLNKSSIPDVDNRQLLIGKKLDEKLVEIDHKINLILKHSPLIETVMVEQKEISWNEELNVNDNKEDYFLRKLIPFSNDNKDFVLLSSSDITDLSLAKKEIDRINEGLEHTIEERTYQLESAIKELDSFSYSVSHDLRSPLRAIDGWSLALIEDYGEKLDDIAIGYINRMRSESKRMGNLIDDLLSLSKIGKRQISRKQINYKDFCLRIINRIIEAEQYKQPEVIIHDNHFIYADENLLDILITNLISNALKFSSKKENPKIEIGVELIDDLSFYYIKDNGAGFEMNNASKLFGAFQRMHKKSEFSGTGIGLATVKRIVNLHGGTIFAESKINEGAAFYFNLNYNTNT